MKRSVFSLSVFLFLCLGFIIFLSHCIREEKTPSTTKAKNFTLKTLEGEEITLHQLKGKTIILDFWATWCGPCRESLPQLIHLYNTYHEKGLEVIGMSLDKGEIENIRHFVNSMGIPYPIIITPDNVARDYGVTGLPTTFFIDKEGNIREKMVGFNSTIAKKMSANAADLISEKP